MKLTEVLTVIKKYCLMGLQKVIFGVMDVMDNWFLDGISRSKNESVEEQRKRLIEPFKVGQTWMIECPIAKKDEIVTISHVSEQVQDGKLILFGRIEFADPEALKRRQIHDNFNFDNYYMRSDKILKGTYKARLITDGIANVLYGS